MDLALIKKLIKVVENSEITEFSVQEGELKIKISKNGSGQINQISLPQAQMNAAPAPAVSETPASEKTPETPSEDENLYEVKSPIVGTFYRAPAPDADSYVHVGDSVSSGSVLCIVEAMKLMNEIESDVSGKIVKILVDNATPVEYNQPLFLIKRD
jgi:acetyl-CoA carboxylase biotin carboxyl carrier protein